jgi:hypothetical protein
MQVDTVQLRKAAARLRQDVVPQLGRAGDPGAHVNVDGAFDLYTTSAPFTEAASAWNTELGLLSRAAIQLADALEAAADDYDRADARSAQRVATTR